MLDFNAVVWLETYLANWPSTLLVVSHDRQFLDHVTTDIIHQHDEVLDTYRGDYMTYLKTKHEKFKQLVREYESQVQYRAHLQAFIDRWRYNANVMCTFSMSSLYSDAQFFGVPLASRSGTVQDQNSGETSSAGQAHRRTSSRLQVSRI
jgi:ATPase subunit of ABC transporter with duplicated ATPase domains